MSKTIPGEKLLLAIHRKLYLLENQRGQLDSCRRVELYRLVKSRWVDLGREEREYILGYISEKDIEAAEKILKVCERQGIKIVTWFDEGYPLHMIDSPPPLVFIRGKLPDPLRNPYVAIVGSRKATEYGKEMTAKIARDLIPYEATVVSGLAYGIDAAAHRAAIECGLPTVAILGCGINYIYPARHEKLADVISTTGAVISEFPWGTPPLRHNFPLRNRVISGLAKAVVVVEAEIKSGSLITARWAADQGREVFAVPGNVGRAMSSGTNLLIKEGAHLVEDGSDIAGVLGLKKQIISGELEKNSGQEPGDDDIKRAIVDFVKSGENNLENLVGQTGLSVQELLPLITEAEIAHKTGW